MPLVSIIIPVYNTEKYLKRCLDSAVNQTYKNIEIIIINDASTDNSKHIIDEYAKNHKNIKVITKTHNEGLSSARNIGMKYAQGEYIFFLDSDDYLKQTTIDVLMNIAKNYNSYLVECAYTSVYGPIKRKKEPTNTTITTYNLKENKNEISNHGNVWNKLYHRNTIKGFEFPNGLWYEDNAFIFPLLTNIEKITTTNKILYYYKRHMDSITLSTIFHPNERIFDQYKCIAYIKEKCQKLGTYEEYKSQIDKILRSKLLFTLLEGTAWFQIPNDERKNLLQNVYAHIKKEYNINSLAQLVNDISFDRIDKWRMPILLKYLENVENFISSDEPLEDAKRIIARYKKGNQ